MVGLTAGCAAADTAAKNKNPNANNDLNTGLS